MAAANGKEHKPTKTLIETRGKGGFVITAPSNGKVHPTGGAYILVTGGLETIASVTGEERDSLWNLARTFHEVPSGTIKPAKGPERPVNPGVNGAEISPGDDYEERETWNGVLEPWGWIAVFSRGNVTYWRRPGKDKGVSATTGHCKGLKVFSSSTPFSTEGTYTKFGAYALLNHGGDHGAAAKALAEAGYGTVGEWAGRGKESPNGPTSSSAVDPSTLANSVQMTDEPEKRFANFKARITHEIVRHEAGGEITRHVEVEATHDDGTVATIAVAAEDFESMA